MGANRLISGADKQKEYGTQIKCKMPYIRQEAQGDSATAFGYLFGM